MWVMRQRSFFNSLLVVLFISATQASLQAQDLSKLSQEFERNQSALASYVVDISETRLSETALPGGNKFNSLSKIKHQIVADISEGKYLVFQNNKQRDISSIHLFEIPGRCWKSINGGPLQEVELTTSYNPYSGFPKGPMNPQTLGLSFCAELMQFIPLDVVINNYSSWQGYSVKVADNLATASSGKTYKVVFGLNKGHYPVENQHGKHVHITVTPIKKEGIWLPEKAVIRCSDHLVIEYNLDWIKVNEELSPDYFNPESVAAACDIEYRP